MTVVAVAAMIGAMLVVGSTSASAIDRIDRPTVTDGQSTAMKGPVKAAVEKALLQVAAGDVGRISTSPAVTIRSGQEALTITADDPADSASTTSHDRVRVLTVLHDGDTEAAFTLDLPPDAEMVANKSGGFDIRRGKEYLGQLEKPWALDAHGKRLTTRYELQGGTRLVQHVDTARAAFPVVADPSAKLCSFGTQICVKFSKNETKRISDATFVGVGAFVGAFCGLIPSAPVPLILVKAACSGTVAAYFFAMRGTFRSAEARGKCTEVKWFVGSVAPVGWKVVNC